MICLMCRYIDTKPGKKPCVNCRYRPDLEDYFSFDERVITNVIEKRSEK